MRRPHAIAVATVLLFVSPLSSLAATYTVTRADDPLAAACVPDNCSLRGAVAAAAITPEADLVLLPAGVFTLARSALNVSGGVTIRGAGATATSIVGTSADVAIKGGALSELIIEGVRFATPAGESITVTDGRLVLRDVDLPNDGSQAIVREQDLSASMLIEASQLPVAACFGATVTCVFTDSRIAIFAAFGAQASVDARRIVSAGFGPSTGMLFNTNGRVRVVDAQFSNHAKPMDVIASDADIVFERTRFFNNSGPMIGNGGGGMVRFDDVEFRDNVVSDANITLPAVLHATDGVA